MTTQTVTEQAGYEIIDHGIDGQQYFPGVGTCFSRLNRVATGVGFDCEDAFNDALDQVAEQTGSEAFTQKIYVENPCFYQQSNVVGRI